MRFVWLHIGQAHFLQKKANKERDQCPAILPEEAWFIKDFYGKRVLFSCETKRVIPSRQGTAISYPWVANHRPGFGSSCLFKKFTLWQIFQTAVYFDPTWRLPQGLPVVPFSSYFWPFLAFKFWTKHFLSLCSMKKENQIQTQTAKKLMFLHQSPCVLFRKKENVNQYRIQLVITGSPPYIIKQFITVSFLSFLQQWMDMFCLEI